MVAFLYKIYLISGFCVSNVRVRRGVTLMWALGGIVEACRLDDTEEVHELPRKNEHIVKRLFSPKYFWRFITYHRMKS